MELVLLVGLPGSGKTSFYRARLADTHDQVSKDLMKSARDKNARQARIITAALAAGRSIVVDNTNVSRAVRAPLVTLGRAGGAELVAYFFPAPVADCLARNRARTGRARVPDVAIHSLARSLEPPTAAEGFDRIYRVVLEGEGAFAVSALVSRAQKL